MATVLNETNVNMIASHLLGMSRDAVAENYRRIFTAITISHVQKGWDLQEAGDSAVRFLNSATDRMGELHSKVVVEH